MNARVTSREAGSLLPSPCCTACAATSVSLSCAAAGMPAIAACCCFSRRCCFFFCCFFDSRAAGGSSGTAAPTESSCGSADAVPLSACSGIAASVSGLAWASTSCSSASSASCTSANLSRCFLDLREHCLHVSAMATWQSLSASGADSAAAAVPLTAHRGVQQRKATEGQQNTGANTSYLSWLASAFSLRNTLSQMTHSQSTSSCTSAWCHMISRCWQ